MVKNRKEKKILDEVVIPIMGPTGAGKSTFINTLLGEKRMQVGHKLVSCTKDIEIAKIEYRDRRLVLVDTPGFDDSHEEDVEILKRIADWLKTIYTKNLILGGVIYLHDLSANRFSGTARQNLLLFNKMCGGAALNKVVLGTTRWEAVDRSKAESRVKELKDVHWKEMLKYGARVCKAENSYKSAFSLIDVLLRLQAVDVAQKQLGNSGGGQEGNFEGVTLTIQSQMVKEKKRVPETDAGRQLRYTLQQALDVQKELADLEDDPTNENDTEKRAKLEAKRRQMDALADQINTLKISLPRRIRLKFFSFW